MRILHIVEASFAGVGRHVLDLSAGQVERGHDVHVAYSPIRESVGFRRERLRSEAIAWHPMAMSREIGPADLGAGRAVRALTRNHRFDVVHGHSTKGGLLARSLPTNPSTTVAYTPNAVYSMNPLLGRRKRRAVAAVERRLSARTDVMVAVSPEEQAHLLAIGVDPSKIHLIPNGIRPVDRADRDEVRRRLALPLDGPVVGYVGRIDGQKAPDDLIEVFDLVARARPDVHFAVIGDGPDRHLLETAATRPPLQARLSLAGEHPGTWAMTAFDVLVLPSRYEGFPYVLIEAAHLGLPIVTTAQASASLLVSGPAEVRTADAGDVQSLAEACLDILDQGPPAGRSCDKRFTTDTMVAMAERAYRGDPTPVERWVLDGSHH